VSNNNVNNFANRSSNKAFGIVMSCFFAALWVFSYLSNVEPNWYFFGISVAFVSSAFLLPKLLTPLNFIWFKFGVLLSKITTPVIMAAVFFLLVTPIAIVKRLKGQNALKLFYEAEKETYWILRKNAKGKSGDMERQF